MATSVDDKVRFPTSVACPSAQPCHVIFSCPGVFITSPHPHAIQLSRPLLPKVAPAPNPISYQHQFRDLNQPPVLMPPTSTNGGEPLDSIGQGGQTLISGGSVGEPAALFERQEAAQTNPSFEAMARHGPPMKQLLPKENNQCSSPGQTDFSIAMSNGRPACTYSMPCQQAWTEASPQSSCCQSCGPNVNTSPGYGFSQGRASSAMMDPNTKPAPTSWLPATSYTSPVATASQGSISRRNMNTNPIAEVSSDSPRMSDKSSLERNSQQPQDIASPAEANNHKASNSKGGNSDSIESPVTPGIESLKNKAKGENISPRVMLRFKDIHGGLGRATVSTYVDEPESPSGHTLLNISNTLLPKPRKIRKNSPAIRAFSFVTPKKTKKKGENKSNLDDSDLDLPPLIGGHFAEKVEMGFSSLDKKASNCASFPEDRNSEDLQALSFSVSDAIGNAFYSLQSECGFEETKVPNRRLNYSSRQRKDHSKNEYDEANLLPECSPTATSPLLVSPQGSKGEKIVSQDSMQPNETPPKSNTDADNTTTMDTTFCELLLGNGEYSVPNNQLDEATSHEEHQPIDSEAISEVEKVFPNDLSYLLGEEVVHDLPLTFRRKPTRRLSFTDSELVNEDESPPSKNDGISSEKPNVCLLNMDGAGKTRNSSVSIGPDGKETNVSSHSKNHEETQVKDTPLSQESAGSKMAQAEEIRDRKLDARENTSEADQISDFVRSILNSSTVDDFKDVNLDACIEAHEYMESLMPGKASHDEDSMPDLSADAETASFLNFLSSDAATHSRSNLESNERNETGPMGLAVDLSTKPADKGIDLDGFGVDSLPGTIIQRHGNNLDLPSVESSSRISAPKFVLPEPNSDDFWSRLRSPSPANTSFSPLVPLRPPSAGSYTSTSIRSLEQFTQRMSMDSSHNPLDPFPGGPSQPQVGIKPIGELPRTKRAFVKKKTLKQPKPKTPDNTASLFNQKKRQDEIRMEREPKKTNNCPIVMGTWGRRGKNQKRVMMFIQPEEMAGLEGEPKLYSLPRMPPLNPQPKSQRRMLASSGSDDEGLDTNRRTVDQVVPKPKTLQNAGDRVATQSPIDHIPMTPNTCNQLLDDILADAGILDQENTLPITRTPSHSDSSSIPLSSSSPDQALSPLERTAKKIIDQVSSEKVPHKSTRCSTFVSQSQTLGSRSRIRKKVTLAPDFISGLDDYEISSSPPGDYQSPAKLRPLHYQFKCFIVGTFMHSVPSHIPAKCALFKVYFGKRQLVYDFIALAKHGEPLRTEKGLCQKCLISVPFDEIEELYGCKNYLRIKVYKNPKIRLAEVGQPGDDPGGTTERPFKRRNQDLTKGELNKSKTHEIELSSPNAQSICSALGNFDPRLKMITRPPKKETKKRHYPATSDESTPPPPPSTSDTESQSPEKQLTELKVVKVVQPADVKKSRNSKGKKPIVCCHCTTGCKTQRCRCRRYRRVCSLDCRCHREKQCGKVNDYMKKFNLDHSKVEMNACLYDNLGKDPVMERAQKDRRFLKLPCCKRQLVIADFAVNLTCSDCDITFKYSWCTGKLHNVEKDPRNHCFKCRLCFNATHVHCGDPKVLCPCSESCVHYIPYIPLRQQLDKAPNNDSQKAIEVDSSPIPDQDVPSKPDESIPKAKSPVGVVESGSRSPNPKEKEPKDLLDHGPSKKKQKLCSADRTMKPTSQNSEESISEELGKETKSRTPRHSLVGDLRDCIRFCTPAKSSEEAENATPGPSGHSDQNLLNTPEYVGSTSFSHIDPDNDGPSWTHNPLFSDVDQHSTSHFEGFMSPTFIGSPRWENLQPNHSTETTKDDQKK